MFGLSLVSAAVGSLTGVALAKSGELVVYQREQQKISQYGFKEVVLITPIVQEVMRLGLESVAAVSLAHLGYPQHASIVSACAVSLLFGSLHFCYESDYSLGPSFNIALKGVCFSIVRRTCGLPAAFIAHAANNWIEYVQGQRALEQRRAHSGWENVRVKYSANEPSHPLTKEEERPSLIDYKANKKGLFAQRRHLEWQEQSSILQYPTSKQRNPTTVEKKKQPKPSQEFSFQPFNPDAFPLLLTNF